MPARQFIVGEGTYISGKAELNSLASPFSASTRTFDLAYRKSTRKGQEAHFVVTAEGRDRTHLFVLTPFSDLEEDIPIDVVENGFVIKFGKYGAGRCSDFVIWVHELLAHDLCKAGGSEHRNGKGRGSRLSLLTFKICGQLRMVWPDLFETFHDQNPDTRDLIPTPPQPGLPSRGISLRQLAPTTWVNPAPNAMTVPSTEHGTQTRTNCSLLFGKHVT
jgi:hypothetical protein